MAQSFLRNKLTGEIRDVEPDSEEYRALQSEVTSANQPMWEQTNVAHAEAIKDRAQYGELLEEDLGHEAQEALRPEALRLDAEGVAPERNPHLTLTPGEIEAGLTPDQKLEDLKAQFDQDVVGRRQEIFDESADAIADSRKQRSQEPAQTGDVLARAGGSDDRENVPRPDASKSSSSGSSAKSSGSSSSPASSPQGGSSQGGDK